jgi:hypothetical protein
LENNSCQLISAKYPKTSFFALFCPIAFCFKIGYTTFAQKNMRAKGKGEQHGFAKEKNHFGRESFVFSF